MRETYEETQQSQELEADRQKRENDTDVSRYLMAAAEERMYRDRWLAAQRDKLHAYLQMLGNGDPHMIHEVIDSIDEFLRRIKK